jgi:hypothetical protein
MAYGSFDAAVADWDDLAQGHSDEDGVIDAALIERSVVRVAGVHRCWPGGYARGSVATALVGRLSPSALLDGPIAGGVGRRTMNFVTNGLSRDAVNELGRVLESGWFVMLAVAETGGLTTTSLAGRATSVAILPLRGTPFDLRRAVQADEADD